MMVRCLLLLALVIVPMARAEGAPETQTLNLFGRTFMLDSAGLKQLAQFAELLHKEAIQRQAEITDKRQAALAKKPAEEMTFDELKRLHEEPPRFIERRNGLDQY